MDNPEDLPKLMSRLENNDPTLTTVRLHRHQGHREDADSVATLLAKRLAKNSTVKKIVLSNVRLGPDGAHALATSLSNHASLDELELALDPLGQEGLQTIARNVLGSPDTKIKKLTLFNCFVGVEGCRAIAKNF